MLILCADGEEICSGAGQHSGGRRTLQAPPNLVHINRVEGQDIRYRYATVALVGGWRETEAEAVQDAVVAGLLVVEDGEFVWRVRGTIQNEDQLAGEDGGKRPPCTR